jgi:hypothetical protein
MGEGSRDRLARPFIAADNFRVALDNAFALPLERLSASTSVIDVLDHVLDKGIVIDAWVRVSLVGIDLLTIEARVVVASIESYLTYADSLSELTARPVLSPRTLKRPDGYATVAS